MPACTACRGHGEIHVGITMDPQDGTPQQCTACQGYGAKPEYTVELSNAAGDVLEEYTTTAPRWLVLSFAKDMVDAQYLGEWGEYNRVHCAVVRDARVCTGPNAVVARY